MYFGFQFYFFKKWWPSQINKWESNYSKTIKYKKTVKKRKDKRKQVNVTVQVKMFVFTVLTKTSILSFSYSFYVFLCEIVVK